MRTWWATSGQAVSWGREVGGGLWAVARHTVPSTSAAAARWAGTADRAREQASPTVYPSVSAWRRGSRSRADAGAPAGARPTKAPSSEKRTKVAGGGAEAGAVGVGGVEKREDVVGTSSAAGQGAGVGRQQPSDVVTAAGPEQDVAAAGSAAAGSAAGSAAGAATAARPPPACPPRPPASFAAARARRKATAAGGRRRSTSARASATCQFCGSSSGGEERFGITHLPSLQLIQSPPSPTPHLVRRHGLQHSVGVRSGARI